MADVTKEVCYFKLAVNALGHLQQIKKDRYVIPLSNPQFDMEQLKKSGMDTIPDSLQLKIELDIFQTPAGLIMAEVEFPSVELATAFLMPDWFLEDVTNNPAYHNSNMSRA